MGFDSDIIGTTSYDDTVGSDVVVITAGIPRKPGMSRDDLLATNAKIMTDVCEQVKRPASTPIVIVVSQSARRDGATRHASHRLRAAAASSARPASWTRPAIARFWPWSSASASKTSPHCSWAATATRWCRSRAARRVGGIPVTQLIKPERLAGNRQPHRATAAPKSSALLKTGSAYYAPAAATAQMVEAVVRDKKRLIPCAAYCDKEYGVGGYYVGVPVILGASGVERIIELKLTDDEQAAFHKSVDAVKQLVAAMAKLV